MVVGGGVEPGLELHLLVADAVGVDVGVDGVGLPGHVAQELVVDLVVVVAERGRLHGHGKGTSNFQLASQVRASPKAFLKSTL